MKFLKGLIIFIFVLVVLILVGLFIFLKSFDINKYRPLIASEISKQIGRNVTIANMRLNLSFINGVYAEVQGVVVSEDLAFGSGDFASVGEAKLSVDVLAYLTKQEIVVSKVVIDALKISVIRDEAGVVNAQKIGPAQKEAAAPSASPEKTSPADHSAPTSGSIPDFSIQTITISNASVIYTDKAQKMSFPVSQVDFTIKNFSLNRPFHYEGHMAVLGAEQNLSISGQALVKIASSEVNLTDVDLEFNLAKLKIVDLVHAVPQMEPAGLKDVLDGKITVTIPSLTAGPSGLGALNVSGKLRGGKMSTQMLPVAIDKITADFSADARDLDVSSFSLQLLTGMVTGKAKVTDYLGTQGLNAQVKAIVIPLEGLVSGLPEGMKLSGGLNADLAVSGKNMAQPDQFLNSLNGTGKFDVKDGKVENFNVLKILLSRMDFFPGLANLIDTNIPEKYRTDYQSNETVLQKAGSSVQITNGLVHLPDIEVVSDLFLANLDVTADPKLNGKVSGQVKLPQDLSEYLALQAPPLAYLKNSDGEIVIPLTSFTGPLTSLKILPDVKALGKTAIEGEGRNQINKLLNKVLKTEESPASEEGGQKAPSPEKELINGVLDKIFK